MSSFSYKLSKVFIRIKKEAKKDEKVFFINVLALLGIFLLIILAISSLSLKKLL